MRNSHIPSRKRRYKRLCVYRGVMPFCRIPHMAYSGFFAAHALKARLCKYCVYQSGMLAVNYRFSVRYRHARAFLSAVLKCVQGKIHCHGIYIAVVIYAYYPALFAEMLLHCIFFTLSHFVLQLLFQHSDCFSTLRISSA